MLRIGLVTGEFPPMEGGVGAFTRELARELAALGHHIHIITDKQARPASPTRRVRDLTSPVALEFAQVYPFIRKWRWPSLKKIVDLVIRHDLDVVNVQYQAAAYNMNSPAINFLPWRLQGVARTVVTFHDLRVPYLFPKAGRVRQAAVHFMARQADGAIVTNYADYESLQSRPQREGWQLCQIPIGSNIATYTPPHIELDEVRTKLGLTAADKLLGYFGFLNESKGAHTLVRALAEMEPAAHLLFIGGQTGSSDTDNNQSYLASLKQEIADLGLNGRVHWTGFVPDKRVSTFLHAADLMVMPYRDGVSLRRGTLMAVLAHGRPLITTHPAVKTPELVHGENVWLVPPDDPDTLTAAACRLLADPALRARLGAGAAQVADRFTWDKIAAETAVFFEQILQGIDPQAP